MKNDNKCYSSLEELYLDNRKLIFAYLQDSNIIDVELQDEIASTVWVKVAERGEAFLEKEKRWVKNYLRIMIKTAISDYFRMIERDSRIINKMGNVIELSDARVSVEDELIAKEMNLHLKKCLEFLNDKEKTLIIMRFKDNLSSKEIGDLLGISEGNVRVRQRRIMIKLQRLLKKEIDERCVKNNGKE